MRSLTSYSYNTPKSIWIAQFGLDGLQKDRE